MIRDERGNFLNEGFIFRVYNRGVKPQLRIKKLLVIESL